MATGDCIIDVKGTFITSSVSSPKTDSNRRSDDTRGSRKTWLMNCQIAVGILHQIDAKELCITLTLQFTFMQKLQGNSTLPDAFTSIDTQTPFGHNLFSRILRFSDVSSDVNGR